MLAFPDPSPLGNYSARPIPIPAPHVHYTVIRLIFTVSPSLTALVHSSVYNTQLSSNDTTSNGNLDYYWTRYWQKSIDAIYIQLSSSFLFAIPGLEISSSPTSTSLPPNIVACLAVVHSHFDHILAATDVVTDSSSHPCCLFSTHFSAQAPFAIHARIMTDHMYTAVLGIQWHLRFRQLSPLGKINRPPPPMPSACLLTLGAHRHRPAADKPILLPCRRSQDGAVD